MRVTEWNRYCPIADAHMVRVSMFDRRGSEYWADIPYNEGAQYRVRLRAAIEALDNAIRLRRPPGKVTIEDFAT